MQAQMTSNLELDCLQSSPRAISDCDPESASANLREQLLLLASQGALAKRGNKSVLDYDQFLNLLSTVGGRIKQEDANGPCRQASYLLVTTYSFLAFRIQEQKISRKDLNDLLSRDLLRNGHLELHQIFFLKGDNNGALRKCLNLLVFYLRDNESDAVTNHTTKIIKQVKGNWQPIATPKCARNAAAIEAVIVLDLEQEMNRQNQTLIAF